MNADELETRPAETVAEPAAEKARDPVGGAADPQPFPHRSRGRSSTLVWLALLLAAAAFALVAWMWWQGDVASQQQQLALQAQQQQYQDQLQQLEQRLAAAQDSSSRQSSELSSGLQQRLQALEANRDSGEDFRSETAAWSRSAQAALEDSQARLNSMDEKLRSLSARSAQSDTELELEEIDYLLRMAQERLELFGDTRSADRALQLADQQVLAFDNPMFIALRREIAAARRALAAADVPDMVTLGAAIDGLQDSLAVLPFRSGVGGATEPSGSGETDAAAATDLPWWQRLKNALSGLVTVRRVDDAELAMPVLADQLALRQRAWLQLEQARLAALSREQQIYQNSLAQAEATITRWFAAGDPQVKLAISELQSLRARNVNPPMPDIGAPWTTLRSLREAGLSPVPVAAAPVPASEPDDSGSVEARAEAAADAEAHEAAGDEPGTDDQPADDAQPGTGTPADTEGQSTTGTGPGQVDA